MNMKFYSIKSHSRLITCHVGNLSLGKSIGGVWAGRVVLSPGLPLELPQISIYLLNQFLFVLVSGMGSAAKNTFNQVPRLPSEAFYTHSLIPPTNIFLSSKKM